MCRFCFPQRLPGVGGPWTGPLPTWRPYAGPTVGLSPGAALKVARNSRHRPVPQPAKGILDNGFRVVEEILGKHPLQIVGLLPRDRIKQSSTVLAESESNLAFDADKVASRINSVRVFEVLPQASDRPRQIRIEAKHRIEDLGSHKNVGRSRVCPF